MSFEMIKNIYFDDGDLYLSDSIKNKVIERRSARYSFDRKLIERNADNINILNFDDLPDGRIKFEYNDAHFEAFFHKGKTKRLFVILNGAVSAEEKKQYFPRFRRWRWYNYADSYWICIEDPMYYDNDDIYMGWYWGTKTKNYRQYVADIAQKLCDRYNIDYNNVVFYGSSGGGTAAIHSAALFGYGVSVAINAQYNFDTPSPYDKDYINDLKKYLDIDVTEADEYKRNELYNVMMQSKSVAFVIIDNILSDRDIPFHLKYLTEKIDFVPRYGLSKKENIYFWLYDAEGESPHISVDNKNIFYCIDFLSKLAIERKSVDEYQSLYLLFNEFWHDSF